MVELVNVTRAENGLPPVKRVNALDDAARYHAADLGQDDYFDHDSYDRIQGKLSLVCGWSTRITSYYPGWSSLSENIAAGYTSPQDVMIGWMSSTGHRANILRESSWEIGVGYYQGSGNYFTYWVQDFGRRDNIYPVVIDNEAASTEDPNVSLYIYGNWSEMRLHNDNDTWTDWQPFQNNVDWQLPNRSGEHTVEVDMRDGGKSATSQDRITLTSLVPQPELGDIPDTLSFFYSVPDQRLSPPTLRVNPKNIGDDSQLNWLVTIPDSTFIVTPTLGTTPEELSISPSRISTETLVTYNETFTLTVTSPADVIGSPHIIHVNLQVIDTSIHEIYLPLLNR